MQKYIILGHENPDVDSIVSGYIYQNYLRRRNIDAEFIIPDKNIDEDTLEICRRFNLEPTDFQKPLEYDEKTKFILVDHHNRKELKNVELIIDHHLDEHEPDTNNCINEPSSSTSCLIVQGNEPFYSIHEIELACMAAMVDTASFHSTKGKEWDLDWIERMVEEKHLDFNKIYEAGLTVNDISNPKEAMFHGLKKHEIQGHKVNSSTIHVNRMRNNWKKINEIVKELQEYITNTDLDYFLFIIHDMEKFETWTYTFDKIGFIRKKYEEYTSRGTTIIPELEEELKYSSKQKIKTDKN